MVLYSGYIAGWSLAHPEKTPPAEPVMTFREKVRESRQLIPLTLLILLVFLSLMVGWATATECAAWGVMGSLAIAWWHDALTWDLLGQRDGNGPRQLHDHADLGGRFIYVDLDGLYRHSSDVGDLGRQFPS